MVIHKKSQKRENGLLQVLFVLVIFISFEKQRVIWPEPTVLLKKGKGLQRSCFMQSIAMVLLPIGKFVGFLLSF
jgi:hypothetical protein